MKVHSYIYIHARELARLHRIRLEVTIYLMAESKTPTTN